jgi:dimethylargininase
LQASRFSRKIARNAGDQFLAKSDTENIAAADGQLIALTRAIPPTINDCELTHIPRTAVDVARATEQHRGYERALAEAGCKVARLPATPHLPDSAFVEDAAVVLPELAIITRPGAGSRQPETASAAGALKAWRPVAFLRAPATLDGGDVLRIGRSIHVGRSGRTNAAGIRQLEELVLPHGYRIRRVAVSGCLHLKSAVTEVADRMVLLNPAWIEPGAFSRYERIAVHPDEPDAANALRIGEVVIYPEAWQRTRHRLEQHSLRVRTVAADELAKAEAGVTCLSLVFGAAHAAADRRSAPQAGSSRRSEGSAST